MICRQCGKVLLDREPFWEQRGFCSQRCSDREQQWGLRELVRQLPLLGVLGDLESKGLCALNVEDDSSPDSVMVFLGTMLGCVVEVALVDHPRSGAHMFESTALFEWQYPSFDVFVGDRARMFAEIDGFLVEDEFEGDGEDALNVGWRRVRLRAEGRNIQETCLRLIIDVTNARDKFAGECDRWSRAHVAELMEIAGSALDDILIAHGIEDIENIEDICGESVRIQVKEWLDFAGWLNRLDASSAEKRF